MVLSIDMEKTGANIRRCVRESGYSVREIMKITGVTVEQTVYKWYRGESLPCLESQLVLCRLFDIPVVRLLVLKDGSPAPTQKPPCSERQLQRLAAYYHAPGLTA